MHNNYYFLRSLSAALQQRLQDSVVSECFSQNKDELIIRFETHRTPFFLKASLLPQFSCLSFPDNFQRTKKNSADLFHALIGCRVTTIRQFNNERSFQILFNNELGLLFKLHGNRANLVLFEGKKIAELFKKNIVADTVIAIDNLDREIDWSYENFTAHHHKPSAVYFTFGKLVWEYVAARGYDQLALSARWDLIQDVRRQLETNNPMIIRFRGTPHLSLLPLGTIEKNFLEPIAAVTEFYHTFSRDVAFEQEKHALTTMLKARIENGKSYLAKTRSKLREVRENSNYKLWADLIMANLHAIKPGAEKIVLRNFYNEDLIEVSLKSNLTGQKNAELYYRKAKNQQIEAVRLENAIEKKQRDLAESEKQLVEVNESSDPGSIRLLRNALRSEVQEDGNAELLPYHEFEYQGFRILVGKNARANDELTLKHSYKEDLWLHARDVPGSHVLVKHQSGKNFPRDVIERAAQLAAYNSKRRNESLCPVVFTPKKFVRKKKGDPPGSVIVEREEVMMVEPRL